MYRLYILFFLLTLLSACGDSDHSNFRASCKGKILYYADGNLTVEKREKEYTFINGKMDDTECTTNQGMIFCYKEKSEGNTRGKEQIAFDRGYYTMSDIRTLITVNDKGTPLFSNHQIYQANCPITIIKLGAIEDHPLRQIPK